MTEQERALLLEEAKQRFPIGTKYWNLNMIGGRSSSNSSEEDLPVIPKYVTFIFSDIKSPDGENMILVKSKKSQHGWVYSNKIWAEIVEHPKDYVKPMNYQIFN